MNDPEAPLRGILARCEEGEISPAVALMEMLIETEDLERVGRALGTWMPASIQAQEIARLKSSNASGCARVVAMLRSGVDSPPKEASIEEGVAFCRGLFDWSVRQSEEASVALYSLGNPDLLFAATREIVDALKRWGALGASRRALDIGCGIGRMELALSPELGHIHGIDVSAGMIEVAQRRCASLGNVVTSTCSGLDLRAFDERAFELVLAIDSFPYLVQSGMPLARTHFAEAARVLRPNGDLIVLNFSYRGDRAADEHDVAALALEAGLEVIQNGRTPFTLWNGAAFRLRKPG